MTFFESHFVKGYSRIDHIFPQRTISFSPLWNPSLHHSRYVRTENGSEQPQPPQPHFHHDGYSNSAAAPGSAPAVVANLSWVPSPQRPSSSTSNSFANIAVSGYSTTQSFANDKSSNSTAGATTTTAWSSSSLTATSNKKQFRPLPFLQIFGIITKIAMRPHFTLPIHWNGIMQWLQMLMWCYAG